MKNPRPFFSLIRVAYTGLAIATLVPPIASCTHSNPAPIQAVDSAPMTGEGDAATFASEVSQAEVPRDGSWTEVGELACGDAICGPAQICLYPAYGCIGLVVPDSGICPEGTGFSSTNGRICIQTTPPSPSCTAPPATGSFDCSGPDTGNRCRTVNPPIPETCSRICRRLCT